MTFTDHLKITESLPAYLGSCRTCGKEEGYGGEFGIDGHKECDECFKIRHESLMNINQKINWKGNQQLQHPNTETHQISEYLANMIKRGYTTYLGKRLFWNLDRINYPQDRKTNYREPRLDGDGTTRSELMNRF